MSLLRQSYRTISRLLPSNNRSSETRQHGEEKKTIIDISLRLSILRGLIHVIPGFISLALIAMNIIGVYMGPELEFGLWSTTFTLAALQVAAKLQELLATASMTTVVFQLARQQLLYGEGLPLDLIGSAFDLTKLEFFWSRATWMGLRTASSKGSRALLIFFMFMVALLGLVIGPASAVLMLPRQTDRIVFTPQIWLNGSSDDLFPSNLTAAHTGDLPPYNNSDPSSCTQPNSFPNNNCIANAYQKLQGLLDSAPDISFWDWTFVAREPQFARLMTVEEMAGYVDPHGNAPHETWATAPHAATGFVQNKHWWDRTWFEKYPQSQNGRTSQIKSKSATARTVCRWQGITINTTEVGFPTLEAFKTYFHDANTPITVSQSTWSQDGVSFSDSDIVSTVWIEGAQTIGPVTAGLVILAPLSTPNDTSRSALACSIDARWAESYSTQSDGLLDIAISSELLSRRRQDVKGSGFGLLAANNSDWVDIKADMDWLAALTPVVPYLEPNLQLSKPASTIANLLMSTNHENIVPIDTISGGYGSAPYHFWEFLISAYFADGVSRVGYAQQLQSTAFYIDGSTTADSKCTNGTVFTPEICSGPPPTDGQYTGLHLQGELIDIYAYHASATTDYLSIVILTAYICIAASHLFYILVWQRSSRAWEKLEDMLALVHSSRPAPEILSNTCAGVENLQTRAKNVRIVVSNAGLTNRDDEGGEEGRERRKENFEQEEEAVQMIFVETMHSGRVYGSVEAGVKYGKME